MTEHKSKKGAMIALGVSLLVGHAATAMAAQQSQATASGEVSAACDRQCLASFEDRYLQSVANNDPGLVPTASTVRFTEDARELPVGDGLWKTATSLRQHRLSVLDDKLGMVGGFAIIDEGDKAALLSYRLKVSDGAITEIETLVSRHNPDGPAMNPSQDFAKMATLEKPNPAFQNDFPEQLRNTREEIVKIADHYPAGLKAGSFVKVDAPMAEKAGRLENGMVLAGPACTFRESCLNMKTQPSPERPTLRSRLLAVDDVAGIAFYWLDWIQSSTNKNLVAFEAFKVYDNNIQAVEAFLKHDDRERYPGWQ